jgi:hypothetical protein
MERHIFWPNLATEWSGDEATAHIRCILCGSISFSVISVNQSVQFARGLRATEFVWLFFFFGL